MVTMGKTHRYTTAKKWYIGSMENEMNSVINRLQTMPPADQEALAPQIARYIDEVEHYRAMVQEGLQSGEKQPLTHEVFQDVIKRGKERHAQRS